MPSNNTTINEVKNALGETYITLRNDDVTASDVLLGKKFHLPSGAEAVGTLAIRVTEVATESEMDDKLTSTENNNKAYKYVGPNTTDYTNNDLYVAVNASGVMVYHHYTLVQPTYEDRQVLKLKLGMRSLGTKEVI